MFENKTVNVISDYATHEVNKKIAVAFEKLAYQKSIENRLSILKELYAVKMYTQKEYENKLHDLLIDCLRGE